MNKRKRTEKKNHPCKNEQHPNPESFNNLTWIKLATERRNPSYPELQLHETAAAALELMNSFKGRNLKRFLYIRNMRMFRNYEYRYSNLGGQGCISPPQSLGYTSICATAIELTTM